MKGFFYLIGGSAFAQIVTIALSPILSRLYTPEAFGIFGFLSALVYFVNSFSLLRLEVELIKKNYSKEEIYQYGITLLSIISLLSLLVVVFINGDKVYYLMPVIIFLSGYYNLEFYNLLAEDNIKKINKNKLLLASSIGISQLLFGFIKLEQIGLLLGHIVGFFITLLFMNKSFFGFRIKGVVNKFKSNILIDAPSMALNIISNHGPTILIFLTLGKGFSGAYYMAFRILILPINIISTSLYNYIGVNFIKWQEENSIKQQEILNYLAYITVIPALITYLFIDKLVIIFLGNQWQETAIIAKICISWLYIRFFFDGFIINFSLLNKQGFNLKFQIYSLVVRAGAILIPFYYGLSNIQIINVFSFMSWIVYVIGLYIIFKITSMRTKKFNIIIAIFSIILIYFNLRVMN